MAAATTRPPPRRPRRAGHPRRTVPAAAPCRASSRLRQPARWGCRIKTPPPPPSLPCRRSSPCRPPPPQRVSGGVRALGRRHCHGRWRWVGRWSQGGGCRFPIRSATAGLRSAKVIAFPLTIADVPASKAAAICHHASARTGRVAFVPSDWATPHTSRCLPTIRPTPRPPPPSLLSASYDATHRLLTIGERGSNGGLFGIPPEEGLR